MREDRILMYKDTMSICKDGYYIKGDKKVELKLCAEEMEEAVVYLPKDIKKLSSDRKVKDITVGNKVAMDVVNSDSFSHARKLAKGYKGDVLILNFANAVHPGGGVKKGSRAQEEDLCRKSSLMRSLESKEASAFYEYNLDIHSFLGSDAVIVNPNVEIIKDENGDLLDETVVVSVITCAAPDLASHWGGLAEDKYHDMMYSRIKGILMVAAYHGYEVLVLGAFGCGAFCNDAHQVSDIFYEVMKEFRFNGRPLEDVFKRIDFAVMDHSVDKYNFNEFKRNFSNYYQDEPEEIKNEKNLDKIRGSLIGGAAGDALGYAVEFLNEDKIFRKYGENGITEYELNDGKALISDDTQMTLFTANGLLVGETMACLRGIPVDPYSYVQGAYNDWLHTQTGAPYEQRELRWSWLLDVPELHSRRAPGTTCITALTYPKDVKDYIKEPLNDSKGCGGVMRVAPVGLFGLGAKEGAYVAAITHGHPLGYMSAAVVAEIIRRIVYGEKASLKEIVLESKKTVKKMFKGTAHLDELIDIIDLAIELSENKDTDLNNIHKLGEGWVAEETVGIALYCALKYQDDFSKAIITAVNHNGDSDSTGAVTGNILGAYIGYEAIEDKWKKNLELHDVIIEIADDLCHRCQMEEYGDYRDEEWLCKYGKMHRYTKQNKQEYTFFWKEDEENGIFSNWYRCPIVIDDFEYFCAEQYMMAQKAKLFHDSKRYTQILRANTAKECKDLGKQVTPFDPAKWDTISFYIVKAVNRAKFEQHPYLMEQLLETGDSIMAEASPLDEIWGIGMDAKNAYKTPMDQWPGKNQLGKVLMELREEFRKK